MQAGVKQGAKELSGPDLTGYRLVFEEEFTGPLSVSAYGPGTKWIAHTPYGGDFGEAWFTDPTFSPSPFSIKNGILNITAWKDRTNKNHWRSGLLSSVDRSGAGFAQALGYYEARMQLPTGPGVWPAFWLDGLGSFKTPKTKTAEVDILEEYGVDSRIAHQNVPCLECRWKPILRGRKCEHLSRNDDWFPYLFRVDSRRITSTFTLTV